MRRKLAIGSGFLVFALSCGCSTEARGDRAVAAQLGYQGCRVSKPLTMLQVMGKDMSGGNEASRAHPDWDALIAKYASGDQVYLIDCRSVDPSRIVAGTFLYALVREGVVVARAAETIYD
jgi:hypothetical protein